MQNRGYVTVCTECYVSYKSSISNCPSCDAPPPKSITQHISSCYGESKSNGWWHDLETEEPLQRNKGELYMLIVSEIAEAFEGARKPGLIDKHLPCRGVEEVELADALIRIFDYAGAFGLDLEGALQEKLEYNKTRADHKIENRKKPGGKKF